MKNNKDLKYQYHLHTWGGFYNEEHQKIHNEKDGDHWFDTAEERQTYIDILRVIEKKLNARVLMMTLSEGYCCNIHTKLHRVIEWEGKRYYSENDMGITDWFSTSGVQEIISDEPDGGVFKTFNSIYKWEILEK